jgi:hypothetical protein
MKLPCFDCKTDTSEIGEYYMLHDEIWQAAITATKPLKRIRFLCVGCIEERLGRELNPADFTDAPINRQSWNSTRLKARNS